MATITACSRQCDMARSCLCLCPGLAMGPGVHSSLKFMFTPAGLGPSPSGSPPQLQLQPVPSLELSQPAVSANARWVVCGCACGFSYGSVSFICTADNTMHEMWKIYYIENTLRYSMQLYFIRICRPIYVVCFCFLWGTHSFCRHTTTAANENIYQLI